MAGKLGQVGGRLMDASVKQLADRFFVAFQAHIAGGGGASVPAQESSTAGGAELPVAARGGMAQASSASPSWFAIEKPRLLWFAAGVAATSIGVRIGAPWLR